MNEPQEIRAGCPEYADRLVDLSDGELTAAARRMVETHVARCDDCREELRRLDGSLAALRDGLIAAEVTPLSQRWQHARTVLMGIGGTAAAILLTIGIASLLKAPASSRGKPPNRDSIVIIPAPAPNILTNGQGFEPDSVTADEALRQIALLEQQARLETSLALMPDEPWYANQRATNEALLSTFRKATMAAGEVDHSPNQTPGTKATL